MYKSQYMFSYSYNVAKLMLKSNRSINNGRRVDNNTRLIYSGDDIAVRLHNTNVVVYHQDGSVTLNSGRWRTKTTAKRINKYAPCCVYQLNYEWYVVYNLYSYEFFDGMILMPCGMVLSDRNAALPVTPREKR